LGKEEEERRRGGRGKKRNEQEMQRSERNTSRSKKSQSLRSKSVYKPRLLDTRDYNRRNNYDVWHTRKTVIPEKQWEKSGKARLIESIGGKKNLPNVAQPV